MHWYPFVHARSNRASLVKNDATKTSTRDATLQDILEHFQHFFTSLERDLRALKKVEKASESEVENTMDREEREKEMMEIEAKICETIKAIEQLITWLFYNQLDYSPLIPTPALTLKHSFRIFSQMLPMMRLYGIE